MTKKLFYNDAYIKEFDAIAYNRLSQLSNKSNQFNLTTKRYSIGEIENVANDSNYITLYGDLKDIFGDNGIVSVVIGNILNNELNIDLWIMSCRVLKRGMENAMMDKLIATCKTKGVEIVNGYYYPTPKNKMVKEFYSDFGFEKIEEDSEGNTKWQLNIHKYEEKNQIIEVI